MNHFLYIFTESPLIWIIEFPTTICSVPKRISVCQISISLVLESSFFIFKIDFDDIPQRVLCWGSVFKIPINSLKKKLNEYSDNSVKFISVLSLEKNISKIIFSDWWFSFLTYNLTLISLYVIVTSFLVVLFRYPNITTVYTIYISN